VRLFLASEKKAGRCLSLSVRCNLLSARDRGTSSRHDPRDVLESIRRCKANGSAFVVAGIYSNPATAEMLEYFSRKGTMTVDISVDLSMKGNTNLPYEPHPSAIANEQYEYKLESFLCEFASFTIVDLHL